LAVASYDGGRIRTLETNPGPGVDLNVQGWNESKNAIFVSARSTASEVDPEPEPPKCFFNPTHVVQLTEQAKTKETAGANDSLPKPKRIHRAVLSSMKNTAEFGKELKKEGARRNFAKARRKAFVANGLACNWKIHAEHFNGYVAILNFVHAVTYVYRASIVVYGKNEQAWLSYWR
jgi:hypothetical protein